MYRRNILAAGCVLAVGAVLSACTPQVTTNVPNAIQVELAGQEKQTVTVSAAETVKVVPDMAQIVYEITTEDSDASRCQQKNGEALAQVLAYLAEQGVEETSMKTSDFSLNPRYDYSGSTRRLIGYEMTTQLTVADVPMDQVGALLSGVVNSGANQIQSVSYYSSQYDEAYDQALELAMKMSKEKAETLAHAGGYQVVGIVSVSEYADNQNGRYVNSGLARNSSMAKRAAAEDAVAEMAVMAGEMEVKANIEVVYEIWPR